MYYQTGIGAHFALPFFIIKIILLLIHVDREKSVKSIGHGAWGMA